MLLVLFLDILALKITRSELITEYFMLTVMYDPKTNKHKHTHTLERKYKITTKREKEIKKIWIEREILI